ncbi:PEP-CTERM system TPR-repeat protein PrsT [Thalassotalea ponticola]|uniref:XrtA/PEP-CTERM system TPR-repeat protein PrsT n=1 Tax=Thalassotalea ponticola TaxID=1523392 RepID=UPI0025B3B382|nr:XrtA/PEP-CTERM system TPR-repeat protein PrsT [Thalassotalea ponticola]MDN3652410.1 PEP-CTERM system TPR-repeat protein PrsT [Thalassotalea ponticola]
MLKLITPALLIAALVACSGQKSSEQSIQDALELIKQSDVSAAVVELKNAIRVDPNANQARFLLAQLYMQTSNFGGAQKELQRAFDNGYDANEIIPLQVRLALLIGDAEKVQEWVNHSSVDTLHPNKQTEIQAIAGIGLTYLGYFKEGYTTLAKVLNDGSQDSRYYTMAKAWLAANEGQAEQAIALVVPLVEQDKVYDDARVLLANLYGLDNDPEQAVKTLEPVLARHGNDVFFRLLYVNMLMRSGELEKAHAETDTLLRSSPNAPAINEVKAELSLRNGNYQEAVEYATIALTNIPNLHKANLIAGIGHYKTGNMEMAYNHLKKIEPRLPKNHLAQQVLTQVKLKLGYIDEAVGSIDTLNALTPNDFAALANATVEMLRSGDTKRAAEYLNKLENIDESNADMMLKRGALKLSVKDESGLQDLYDALIIDPELREARLALIHHYLQSDQLDMAMIEAERWIEEIPEREGGQLAKGLVWRQKGDLDQARSAFQAALKVNENSIGAHYNLAQIANRQQRYDDSLRHLEQLFAHSADHQGALRLAVNLAPNVGDQAITGLLEKLSAQEPDNLALAIATAQTYDNLGQAEIAMQQLSNLRREFGEQPKLLSAIAKVAIRNGDYAMAEQTFKQILDVAPRNFTAQLGLLMALENQGKDQQAYTEVKKAQQTFINVPMLHFFEANFLYKTKAYKAAQNKLASINPLSLEAKAYWNLATKVDIQLQQWQRAVKSAANWYQAEDSVASSTSYARTLAKAGQHEQAMKIAQQAYQKHGSHPGLDSLMAELNLEQDPEASFKYYQKLATQHPKNFGIQNNLAWAALQIDKLDVAYQAAEKAAELAPDNPHVMDTLAITYMRKGEFEKADKLMQQVQKQLPNSDEVKIHYAELLVRMKEFEKAKTLLDSIVDSEQKQKVMSLYDELNG